MIEMLQKAASLAVALSTGILPALAADSAAESLKRFVQSSPIIEGAKFEIRREGFPPQYVFFQCQPGALLFRACTNLNELLTLEGHPTMMSGSSLTSHWYYSIGSLVSWEQSSGEEELADNPVRDSIEMKWAVVNRLLSIGCHGRLPEDVSWSGATYSYEPLPGIRIKGALFENKGQIARCESRVLSPTNTLYEKRILYDYKSDGRTPFFFPSGWRELKYSTKRGEWILIETVQVHLLSLGDKPIPHTAFSPAAAGVTNVWLHSWVDGTNMFFRSPETGKIKRAIPVDDPRFAKVWPRSQVRWLYLGASVLVLLPLTVALWNRRKSIY